jgi:general secretion pathway protein E
MVSPAYHFWRWVRSSRPLSARHAAVKRCFRSIWAISTTLLRSLLRQDPDIMLVGEIRDLETARIASQAALTGHLLLSTLHTNDAVGAVIRLIDMGLEDYLVAAVLKGVLAQRLVRALCPGCRQPQPAELALIEYPLLADLAGDDLMLYRPGGCAACGGTG